MADYQHPGVCFNAWAVYEFFQEGGAACYVVRAADKNRRSGHCDGVRDPVTAATNGTWGASLMYYISSGVRTE